jgi:hypothetical protein
MAESLYKAAVLGIKAMNVPKDRLHLLSLTVLVKSPEVFHSIAGASLEAWLFTEWPDSEGTGGEGAAA